MVQAATVRSRPAIPLPRFRMTYSQPRLIDDPAYRAALLADAVRQLDFFAGSLRRDGGFDLLNLDGTPLPRDGQELHTTTRLIHSYCMGRAIGHPAAERMIDAGMDFLRRRHRDDRHGGFLWSVDETGVRNGDKLAYGHAFVLLAASSARKVGHPDADMLFSEISEIIAERFLDKRSGLLEDEFHRDWTRFSGYRGLNSNMHAAEAMLAAFEATSDPAWLAQAGHILQFFASRIAPVHGDRLPEHYAQDWSVDEDASGNPIFRPAGRTPGHSFEVARLSLQHWDLAGRPSVDTPTQARRLIEQALDDAWLPEGGIAYTLHAGGQVDIATRYAWPVAEAILAVASLQAISWIETDEAWYRQLTRFASEQLIDQDRGGWYPELDAEGRPSGAQFAGKPDLYHSLQAALHPLAPILSHQLESGFGI